MIALDMPSFGVGLLLGYFLGGAFATVLFLNRKD